MRRRIWLAGAAIPLWLLAGCAGVNGAATRWYELRSEPPGPIPAPRPGDGAVWEVAGGVSLPGALERDTLVLSSGAASLQPLAGHRWVEPLRDSIPRVLVADLGLLRGPGLVWRAPAPAGANATRRLRVEVVTLMADAGRGALRLQARWWLSDARSGAGAAAPAMGSADFSVPLLDGSVDALAAAHRLALWQLAVRIAGGS